jgi:hypothetical protein
VFTGSNLAPFSKTAIYDVHAQWLAEIWLKKIYDAHSQLFTLQEQEIMRSCVKTLREAKPKAHIFNLIIDVYGMADTMAKDIGTMPPDYKCLIASGNRKDIELGVGLLLGPLTPAQCRIQGPFAVENATSYIINQAKQYIGEKI